MNLAHCDANVPISPNPQTWNRYAYVGSNPLVLTDPTGEDWWYSADQQKYQWGFSSPGSGFSKVENFTYYAGEKHQWVALDPFRNAWTDGHSNTQVAENSIDGRYVGWKTLQFFAGLSGVGEGGLATIGKIMGLELPYVNENSTPHRGGAGASTILQITALPAIAGASAGANTLRSAAMAETNAAQALSPRPAAAGAMQTVEGQIVRGASAKGPIAPLQHPLVQGVLDNTPNPARGHGFCAEPRIISNALNQGLNPRGGVIDILKVGGPNSARHGSPFAPCTSCQFLLKEFQITPVTPR